MLAEKSEFTRLYAHFRRAGISMLYYRNSALGCGFLVSTAQCPRMSYFHNKHTIVRIFRAEPGEGHK